MTLVLDMFSLSGKIVLITGATRGIGQAMALALAEAGGDILSVQRDAANTQTKEAIEKLGRKCIIYTADLTSPLSVNELARKICAEHQIDILVNCAGIQSRHPAAKFPDEDWNRVIQVNLNAPFVLCREIGAQMLSRQPDAYGRRGNIINVASLLTFQGGLNVPAYSASKGGIAQMTKTMSNEWASKGISVNCIAPGYIYTDMNEAIIKDASRAPSILERIPAGRWGKPEDFKGPIVFLASHAAAYVNGEVLVVDGGWMGR